MASYNGEKYIAEQIESILKQIKETDELIISDDGSTDRTLDIVEEFHDSRIKVLHHNKGNYTKNFENALTHASGDIIFLCDQDDIWKPDKVKTTLQYFRNTGADFLVSAATLVDGDMNVILESSFEGGRTRTGFWYNLAATSYIGACMAFKKKILNQPTIKKTTL